MPNEHAADAAPADWYQYLYEEHLLTELMQGWSTLLLLMAIVACIAVLVKGADWLVEGAVSLAERTGLPKIVIGATVVSLGTTTPECFVSVMAAWFGNPGLALGNGVGSIVCDTGMIFGLLCLVRPMALDRYILNRQGWVQFGSAALLVAVSLGLRLTMKEPVLGREVGVLFLVLLAVYMLYSIKWARQHGLEEKQEEALERAEHVPVWRGLAQMAVGLVMIIASSRLLVPAVGAVASRLGVPDDIIAATLVAFGTSLPELVTSLMSIKKGHAGLAVGNIIGADILNVLFVIGAAATVMPLALPGTFFLFHFPVMMLILICFRSFIFINRDGKFKRWQGGLLLTIYLGYIVLQYAFRFGN